MPLIFYSKVKFAFPYKTLEKHFPKIYLRLMTETYNILCFFFFFFFLVTIKMLSPGVIFKIFFSRTKKAFRLNLGIYHWGRKVYRICSNDEPRMTFNLLKGAVKFLPLLLWQYGGMLHGI